MEFGQSVIFCDVGLLHFVHLWSCLLLKTSSRLLTPRNQRGEEGIANQTCCLSVRSAQDHGGDVMPVWPWSRSVAFGGIVHTSSVTGGVGC
jgi:hypothetical protein